MCPGIAQDADATLVRERVARDRVVVGGHDQEADPPLRERTGTAEKHRGLGSLDIRQEEVDPLDREILHETVDRQLPRQMRLVCRSPRSGSPALSCSLPIAA